MPFKLSDPEVWTNLCRPIQERLGEDVAIFQLLGGINQSVVNQLISQFGRLKRNQSLLLVIDSHGGSMADMERLRSALSIISVPKAALVIARAYSAALELLVTGFDRDLRFAKPESIFLAHSASVGFSLSGQVNAPSQMIGGLTLSQLHLKLDYWAQEMFQVETRRTELWSTYFESEAKRQMITVAEYLTLNIEISSYKALELGLIGHVLDPAAR